MRGVGWLNYDSFPAWPKVEVGKIMEKVLSFPSNGNNGKVLLFCSNTYTDYMAFTRNIRTLLSATLTST